MLLYFILLEVISIEQSVMQGSVDYQEQDRTLSALQHLLAQYLNHYLRLIMHCISLLVIIFRLCLFPWVRKMNGFPKHKKLIECIAARLSYYLPRQNPATANIDCTKKNILFLLVIEYAIFCKEMLEIRPSQPIDELQLNHVSIK